MTEEEVTKLKKDAAKKKKKNPDAGFQLTLYNIMKTNKHLHELMKDHAATDSGSGKSGTKILKAVMPVFNSLPEDDQKMLRQKALDWMEGGVPRSVQIK